MVPGGHGQQLDAIFYLVHFLFFHGCIAGRKIHGVVEEIFNAGAAPFGLIIHQDIFVDPC